MRMSKELPMPAEQIVDLTKDFPTPFHLYDERGIRAAAHILNDTFSWVSGADGEPYMNHYAVKANPNPHILEIVGEEGMGADASSGPEIRLANAVGIEGSDVMFTANHVQPNEYRRAYEADATINLDDADQLDTLMMALGRQFPKTISFRYNPGDRKVGGVNSIIGNPIDSKFGAPDGDLLRGYKTALELSVQHLGMHAMLASNELDAANHIATARLVFEKIAELSEALEVPFEFANLGGGIGIAYSPDDTPVNFDQLSEGIQQAYEELILARGLPPLRVVTENGRFVTGPHGWLITKVTDVKEGSFHRDIGVDATTVSDLPRPAAYDAYHEISLVGESFDPLSLQRVVGSLCEDNDYFTGAVSKERLMTTLFRDDILAIHDTGAHCRAMGSNYNGKLRCGELLLRMDGSVQMIRRPETEEDLFATLDYPQL